jgi:hypothetical protein
LIHIDDPFEALWDAVLKLLEELKAVLTVKSGESEEEA